MRLLLFFLVIAVPVLAKQDTTRFHRALAYAKEGNFFKAEKHFRQALLDEPGNPYVKCEMAFCLYNQKRYTEALPYLNEVIQKQKLFERAYYYKGLVYYELKKYREAIKNFDTFQRIVDRNRVQFKLSCWYIGAMYQELLYREGLTREEMDAMILNYKTYIWKNDDLQEEQDIREFLDLVTRHRPEKHDRKWKLNVEAGEAAEFIETGSLTDDTEKDEDAVTTMASLQLQKDTYRQIKIAEKVVAKSCTTHKVLRAEFLKVTEDFLSRDGKVVRGGWQEVWTIDRCGQTAVYLILFEVNEKGGTYIFLEPVGKDYMKNMKMLDLKEEADIKIKKK